MRKLLAVATGTITAVVLMLAPTAAASAAPSFAPGGHTVAPMCGFCNVGW